MFKKLQGAVFLFVAAASQTYAGEPQRGGTQRPEWVQRADASFSAGDQKFPVYQDPFFRTDFLIYDGNYCWLVNTESRTVSSLGCGIFDKTGDRLALVDHKAEAAGVYADGAKRLAGVEWVDAVWDCSSLWSLLVRRPDFSDKAVRFWACDKTGWATLKVPSS